VLYTNNWDNIRRQVYKRDNYRCVLCGQKKKLHAHHIIPIKVSKNNSLSNLVSVCDKCHRKLEAVGLKILQEGGSRAQVRRTELKMIMEAKSKRKEKYLKKINESGDKNGKDGRQINNSDNSSN
jgi:hypothetical protein